MSDLKSAKVTIMFKTAKGSTLNYELSGGDGKQLTALGALMSAIDELATICARDGAEKDVKTWVDWAIWRVLESRKEKSA